MYKEFQREKEDLLESVRMLQDQMQLKDMVIEAFIPPEEVQKVMRRAHWDDEREVGEGRSVEGRSLFEFKFDFHNVVFPLMPCPLSFPHFLHFLTSPIPHFLCSHTFCRLGVGVGAAQRCG